MQWRMVAPTTQARSTECVEQRGEGRSSAQVDRHQTNVVESIEGCRTSGETMAAMHYNETLARRIVAEVDHVTAGRPMRWGTLQQVARRLKVHHSSAATAVRVPVDGGWLIAEGSAPHSVYPTQARRALPQPPRPRPLCK